MRSITLVSAFLVVVSFSACVNVKAPNEVPGLDDAVALVNSSRLLAADSEPGMWMAHGRTYSEQRFSPLEQIDTHNVGQLGLVWTYKLDVDRATEATPIVVDGVMYVTGAYSIVSALDATTGKELWKFDPEVPRAYDRNGCCDVANRGVAVWQGRVYVGSYDGRLIALNARNGQKVWEVDTVLDRSRSYTVTGAPRVVKGKVLIGNGGAEFGVRGYVTAYDAETGRMVWRFFTVPRDPASPPENKAMTIALPTWSGGRWWKDGGGGGGTVWDSMAYDPELDILYIGTGNASIWNREIRSPGGGDNLFVSSIIALKPDTGDYVWHYQTTPGDAWDYTATQHMILADLPMEGQMRKIIMQAPKNGFFYVLDRATGQLLSAEKYAPANWAERVDIKSGRPIETSQSQWFDKPSLISPGPLGAHNWQPMSFNPKTGLVYIPMQEAAALYVPNPEQRFSGKGIWHMGTRPIALPENDEKSLKSIQEMHKGNLIAWDPVKKKEVWRHEYSTVWNGGTLTTAGNLVFQGTADGRFVAYSADKGEKLWEMPANTGVMAGPISYSINGEQYVSVAAGWGGAFPLILGGISTPAKVRPEARVLTFRLGGNAKLPPPKSAPARRLAPPDTTLEPERVANGRDLYNAHCGMCHGPSAIGGSVLPDLRYLSAENHAIFYGILAGAYVQRGMPSFVDVLDARSIENIHQYLIQRTRDLEIELSNRELGNDNRKAVKSP